jgi:WD40 repeat protein
MRTNRIVLLVFSLRKPQMQVNSAQDYLTQVKRQLLAKAPALALSRSPQNRKSNETYISQLANRSSQYEKVPYPQTLSLAPGSVPGLTYVIPGLRPTVSLCCPPLVRLGEVFYVVSTLTSSIINLVGLGGLPNGNVVASTVDGLILSVTPGGSVSTLAGSTLGFNDGVGTNALFSDVNGVAVFPNGNIVVADNENFRVRLITMPSATVTTIAGGTVGTADGVGTAAQFQAPFAVAILPNGNIVVCDVSRIRLITGNVVTTLAGAGNAFADGVGTNARFNRPNGVAALPNGNIVVADTNNHRIRLIDTSTATVSTIAGQTASGTTDGVGTNARFNLPRGVVVLPDGNILVADSTNNRIRLITMPSATVTTIAGGTVGTADGVGTAAQLSAPRAFGLLPNGTIAVVDGGSSRIRLLTPNRITTPL